MRLRNSRRDGYLLVGCLSFSHRTQGGWMRGGSGAVGSFFFLPPAVVVVMASGGEGSVFGVSIGIFIRIPSIWGGRDG